MIVLSTLGSEDGHWWFRLGEDMQFESLFPIEGSASGDIESTADQSSISRSSGN